MDKLYFLWDGFNGRAVVTEAERDALKDQGFIEVDGFEIDRVLPNRDEVLAKVNTSSEYETKVLTAKKRSKKSDEGDK